MSDETIDVCVIGSGFGGSVAAFNLSQAGRRVLVLEKGYRWGYSGDAKRFQQSQCLSYLTQLFDVHMGYGFLSDRAAVVLTGKGVGGGSLVYSSVCFRPPAEVFETRDDGRRIWPEPISNDELDKGYAYVRERLNVTSLLWQSEDPADHWKLVPKKDWVFARCVYNFLKQENAPEPETSCNPVDVALQQCVNSGWCTTGCVFARKQSLMMNYVPAAEQLGAEFRTECSVEKIETRRGGGYKIVYKRSGEIRTRTVVAELVVLSAGAIGTPEILLRSKGRLTGQLRLSDHVGKHLSMGGDNILFGIVSEQALPDPARLPPGAAAELETYKGKIIGTTCDYFWRHPELHSPPDDTDPPKFIYQPIMALPIGPAALLGVPGETRERSLYGVNHKQVMKQYGSRMISVGVMGIDGDDGSVELVAGIPTVRWRAGLKTTRMHEAAKRMFHSVLESFPGGKALKSWDELREDQFTLHPSGSCRMGEDARYGVVNADGQVFHNEGGLYEGLYVMDVSVLSSPPGGNTSYVTAAIAERASRKLAGLPY
ncbi:MAG: GMC family oxidoreductase [Acidobacteria bacterium]|nr:GMC family oxidoreductase [Acidobacteriota bacterium]MBI3656276.1 GMC family oxidoreductase [Acidobacteriota bacterium]